MIRIIGVLLEALGPTIQRAIRGDQQARERLKNILPQTYHSTLERALDEAAADAKFGTP